MNPAAVLWYRVFKWFQRLSGRASGLRPALLEKIKIRTCSSLETDSDLVRKAGVEPGATL